MVARQQQTHRSRERQAAVASVRREPFETAVRRNLLRQVVQIRERVQAQRIVADLHPSGVQPHVLQRGRVVLRECEVLFQNPGLFRRADDLRFREPFDLEKPAFVDDAFRLAHGIQKQPHGILIPHLFRGQVAPAEGVERRLLPRALPCGFGDEQVAGVIQVRTFVEMPFIAAA